MSTPTLTLYSRPGCHLCDDARAALERVRARAAFDFPTAARVGGLDFSFAGLKTALLYKVRELGEEETVRRAADLAASYEHAIVEALIMRVKRALETEPRLAIGGGVAANRLLRERAASLGVPVHSPPPQLCTDNAAMIASAARWVQAAAFPEYLALDAYANRRAA
jgi:N6-L-threonylcarbamoyladenine synthase